MFVGVSSVIYSFHKKYNLQRTDKAVIKISLMFCILYTHGASDVSEVASNRGSRLQMFFRRDVFKTFAIFVGKHLCWNIFLMKLQACRTAAL